MPCTSWRLRHAATREKFFRIVLLARWLCYHASLVTFDERNMERLSTETDEIMQTLLIK